MSFVVGPMSPEAVAVVVSVWLCAGWVVWRGRRKAKRKHPDT